MNKNRCVIVAGGEVTNPKRIREEIHPETDYIIYCDCGLAHKEMLGVEPDLIVGDFDSYAEPETTVEKIVLPTEKDDTDSIFAVKTAIARGYTDFLLIGMLGGRMDHSLGNLYSLVDLHHKGLYGKILCGDSDYQIVGKQTVTIPDDCRYFSLVNLTGLAKGITITGAKYPLADGEILPEYQYGISNEVLPGQTAKVCVQEGELLLIRIFKA